MTERLYSQRYRTEDSEEAVAWIDFIVESDGRSEFVVKVKQGEKPFPALDEAEAWLQKRIASGSKILKG